MDNLSNKQRIFLSYAREDIEKVKNLYNQLHKEGFYPWMDTKDILPGEDWRETIIRAIRHSTFCLVCLSNNSVDKRGIIQLEIKEALEVWKERLDNDIYLIPARLEECKVPDKLAVFHWVDIYKSEGFNELIKALKIGLERLGIIHPVRLRSKPIRSLSLLDAKKILQKYDFFHKEWYWMGKGIQHNYVLFERNNHMMVLDYTTGLIWQQSGSEFMQEEKREYKTADKYITKLNSEKFGGFNDWRLPTIEEAMSLVDNRLNNGLYLSPVFDSTQFYILTSDFDSEYTQRWAVIFTYGGCNVLIYGDYYVRATRNNSPDYSPSLDPEAKLHDINKVKHKPIKPIEINIYSKRIRP